MTMRPLSKIFTVLLVAECGSYGLVLTEMVPAQSMGIPKFRTTLFTNSRFSDSGKLVSRMRAFWMDTTNAAT